MYRINGKPNELILLRLKHCNLATHHNKQYVEINLTLWLLSKLSLDKAKLLIVFIDVSFVWRSLISYVLENNNLGYANNVWVSSLEIHLSTHYCL